MQRITESQSQTRYQRRGMGGNVVRQASATEKMIKRGERRSLKHHETSERKKEILGGGAWRGKE